MNIALIPNRDKPDALHAAEHILQILNQRLSANTSAGKAGAPTLGRLSLMACPSRALLQEFQPHLLIVLGGDGSILSTAQLLDAMHVPIVGINFGKLGYLAAYSLEEFLEHLDVVLAGTAPKTHRLMLHAAVYPWKSADPTSIFNLSQFDGITPVASGIALNDVVINAGEPFRMIELEVQIDEERTTTFRSDGLVVATASGSTGYNLSAGGPLISPEVEAMVLTPICPHTLSFRPVVLPATSAIVVFPRRLNPGSRVSFDGQVNVPLTDDQCLLIRRAPHDLTLVENPNITHWQMLAQKMHWARSPR